MNEAQEVTIRTKDGMTYGYKNVKAFSVTPYDYQIIHMDGSARLINRAGVVDIVLSPEGASKMLDATTPIGTA